MIVPGRRSSLGERTRRRTIIDGRGLFGPAPGATGVDADAADVPGRRGASEDARDRVVMEARLVELAARGDELLEQAESDPEGDSFSLRDAVERQFDGVVQKSFEFLKDPALRASAVRRLTPVRSRLLERVDVMQEEAEDRFFAQTVFGAAERTLGAAAREPQRAEGLFDGVLNLIAQTPLTDARKNQVATAVAAQALRRNLGGELGRLSRFRKPAKRMLAELDAEDEVAARVKSPGAGAVSAPAAADAREGREEVVPSTGPQLEDTDIGPVGEAAAVSVLQPARIPPARTSSAFQKALTRRAVGALTGAGVLVTGLASLFLMGMTRPAGPEPQVREVTSQDGRRFILETREDEGRGRLTIVDPIEEEVRFDINGAIGDGVLKFSHGAISMGDGRQLPLAGSELADVIDAVSDEFAKAGMRIEIADDEGANDGGDRRSSAQADRAGSQGTANPDPDSENDDDDTAADEDPNDPNSEGFQTWLSRQGYEDAPFHRNSVVVGRKNPKPTNGGDALRFSSRYSDFGPNRVAIDPKANEFVIFMRTRQNMWHGHMRQWSELNQKQQAILRALG